MFLEIRKLKMDQNENDNNKINLEAQEKTELIKEILNLQSTLEALATRVETVTDENSRLRQENDLLGEYIKGLTDNSSDKN